MEKNWGVKDLVKKRTSGKSTGAEIKWVEKTRRVKTGGERRVGKDQWEKT